MKKIVAALAVAVALLAFHTEVHASCVTNTIFGSNGRTTFCTTCCYSGSCTTTCF